MGQLYLQQPPMSLQGKQAADSQGTPVSYAEPLQLQKVQPVLSLWPSKTDTHLALFNTRPQASQAAAAPVAPGAWGPPSLQFGPAGDIIGSFLVGLQVPDPLKCGPDQGSSPSYALNVGLGVGIRPAMGSTHLSANSSMHRAPFLRAYSDGCEQRTATAPTQSLTLGQVAQRHLMQPHLAAAVRPASMQESIGWFLGGLSSTEMPRQLTHGSDLPAACNRQLEAELRDIQMDMFLNPRDNIAAWRPQSGPSLSLQSLGSPAACRPNSGPCVNLHALSAATAWKPGSGLTANLHGPTMEDVEVPHVLGSIHMCIEDVTVPHLLGPMHGCMEHVAVPRLLDPMHGALHGIAGSMHMSPNCISPSMQGAMTHGSGGAAVTLGDAVTTDVCMVDNLKVTCPWTAELGNYQQQNSCQQQQQQQHHMLLPRHPEIQLRPLHLDPGMGAAAGFGKGEVPTGDWDV